MIINYFYIFQLNSKITDLTNQDIEKYASVTLLLFNIYVFNNYLFNIYLIYSKEINK